MPPEIFWAMSLVEWRAAISRARPRAATPLARDEFEELMQAFPDR